MQECGVCHGKIDEEEETTSCPACGLPYHSDCWQENRGCALMAALKWGVYQKPDIRISVADISGWGTLNPGPAPIPTCAPPGNVTSSEEPQSGDPLLVRIGNVCFKISLVCTVVGVAGLILTKGDESSVVLGVVGAVLLWFGLFGVLLCMLFPKPVKPTNSEDRSRKTRSSV